jgi:hypothetical protein
VSSIGSGQTSRTEQTLRIDGILDREVSRRIEWLTELECSLRASQESILSRDIERLEQLTSKQARLLSGPEGRDPSTLGEAREARESNQLRSLELRVLDAARVQQILLRRMERGLRAVHNLAPGSQGLYNPRA